MFTAHGKDPITGLKVMTTFGSNLLPDDGGLVIDSSMTFDALCHHPKVKAFSALQMALRILCAQQTQRQKSIGQVLYQDAAYQGFWGALLALDAQLVLDHFGSERVLSLSKVFDPQNQWLKTGEKVKGFYISQKFCEHSVYQSVDYLRSGQAVCGVAAWAYKTNGTIDNVRIILSGCTPVPVYLERMSNIMIGRECTMEEIEKAIQRLEEERLVLQNPQLVIGSHLFNLSKTLIKRALMTL
jgi:CO/xanthine dehydrogenase FAD-binding subunit